WQWNNIIIISIIITTIPHSLITITTISPSQFDTLFTTITTTTTANHSNNCNQCNDNSSTCSSNTLNPSDQDNHTRPVQREAIAPRNPYLLQYLHQIDRGRPERTLHVKLRTTIRQQYNHPILLPPTTSYNYNNCSNTLSTMEILSPTTQYATLAALLIMAATFLLYQPTGLVRWLQKKNYQYEVTFALYMLTPTEKFVFNSILFLTLSMFTLAVILYLPDHILTISRRGYYYCAGAGAGTWTENSLSGGSTSTSTATLLIPAAADKLGGGAHAASGAVVELAGTAYQVAVNTAVAAQEAVTGLGWE
ncbi:hypothetical protein D0862_14427, partial [Hortaea werneckii]